MKRIPTHRKKSSAQISGLLFLLGQSFNRKAWHGTNLRGSVRGLKAREAAWRPSPEKHNIREIVIHCAYWKYIVRRRILGEKKGSFPIEGSNWFRRSKLSEQAWKDDVGLLDACHQSLMEAISGLSDGELLKTPTGSKVNNLAIITGIASHDVYHAGQIQLLKRLSRSGR